MGAQIIPGLPDDLAGQCLARVSLQPDSLLNMKLVCKTWKELYKDSESTIIKERFRLNLGEPQFFLVPFIDEFSKQHSVCIPYKSYILILGGALENDIGRSSSEFWIADTVSRRVRKGPNMIHPRIVFSCCVVGDRVYALGGMRRHNEQYEKERNGEFYDFKTSVWSPIAPLPDHEWYPRCLVDTTARPCGKIYLIEECGKNALCYSPDTDSWTCIADSNPLFVRKWMWCSGQLFAESTESSLADDGVSYETIASNGFRKIFKGYPGKRSMGDMSEEKCWEVRVWDGFLRGLREVRLYSDSDSLKGYHFIESPEEKEGMQTYNGEYSLGPNSAVPLDSSKLDMLG